VIKKQKKAYGKNPDAGLFSLLDISRGCFEQSFNT
jgi:hypothetical protein